MLFERHREQPSLVVDPPKFPFVRAPLSPSA
jgi:hypothetical protein